MDKQRRGASISVKMIATSTVMILVIVVLFGALNIWNTSKVFDESAARQKDSFVASLQRRGQAQAKDLVQASRVAILNNDFSNLQSFVPEIAKDDPEVAYVFVADKEGQIMAHSNPASNGKGVTDPIAKEMLKAKDAVTKEITGQYLFSRPVVDQSNERQGTVVLAYSLQLLENNLKKLEGDKVSAFRSAELNTALIGLFFTLIGTALAIFQGLRISRPLK